MLATLLSTNLLLLGIFLALTFFGYRYGKSKGVGLLLSLYVASVVFPVIPGVTNLIAKGGFGLSSGTLAALIFTATAVVVYLLVSRFIVGEYPAGPLRRLIEGAILSVLSLIFIFVASYHILPSPLIDLGPGLQDVFSSDRYLFWLLIAPLLSFFFISRATR